ncbi:hypothetical protein DM872_18925 [Pseudomonas taiwanensis]|nr:hypothetical protein [Pseudomonas taiwanensis]
MRHPIQARSDATEEHLATLGQLREAIDNRAKLSLLIGLRSSFKPHREWQSERQYLIDRHKSPLLPKLLASLEASGVPLRDALTVPLRFAMDVR